MKCLVLAVLMFWTGSCFSQEFIKALFINRKAQAANTTSPQALAQELTAPYKTDLEKVQAIFWWITDNIAYRTKADNIKSRYTKFTEDDDTSTRLKPLDERVAEIVLRNGVAVCDGYARLFKTLCDYAGLRAEVITGYAQVGMDRVGSRFRSNHTWNAVMIDSTWHLLDATWASGYITFSTEQFVRRYDGSYFLTPPKQFIYDHYPEDLQWSLLADPPILKEFQHTPFKSMGFVKYKIASYSPAKGMIEAAVGDTIQFEIETADEEKHITVLTANQINTASSLDSTAQDFVRPAFTVNGKKVSCTYVVASDSDEWLHVVYNDNIILRYRLKIKKDTEKSVVSAVD